VELQAQPATVDADPCGRIGRAIQESGTPLLDNRVLEVRGHNVRLHVGGVDDVWMGRPNLDAVLARLPDAGNSAAILLAHEPSARRSCRRASGSCADRRSPLSPCTRGKMRCPSHAGVLHFPG